VDADLRRPAIARLYRVPAKNHLSLTSCALGQQGTRQPLRVHIGAKARLSLVYEEEPSAADVVNVLNGLPACLERWRVEHQVIVIRAAPLSKASDGLVISESCDAVILAIDPRTAERRRLLSTVTRLRQRGLPLVAAMTTSGASQPAARQAYRFEYPAEIVVAAPRPRTEPPSPL
jgi:Mrp family chromosome partitioning ATPase